MQRGELGIADIPSNLLLPAQALNQELGKEVDLAKPNGGGLKLFVRLIATAFWAYISRSLHDLSTNFESNAYL